MLDTTFDCQCGRAHTVALKKIVYNDNALDTLPGMLGEFVHTRDAVVVADTRTFRIAGQESYEAFDRAG